MSKRSEVVLALFVRNEKAGCEKSVPDIDRSLFSEVFAIDAGSSDGSAEYLETQGIKVYVQSSKGYSGAYEDAVRKANGRKLIVFHPKGNINPEVLARMVAELNKGSDLVIASRMVKDGKNADDDTLFRHRKWFGRFAGLVLYFRFGQKSGMPIVKDPLHGVRGLSQRLINHLTLRPNSVVADLEIVRIAYKNQLIVAEIPVSEAKRISGKTNFPTFRTGFALFSYLFR
jgi:glycosyltransferase involved in cell wall biosynthesis